MAPDAAVERARAVAAELSRLGVPASRQQVVVAGAYNDVRAMRAFVAARDGGEAPADDKARRSLEQGLRKLEELLEEKRDEQAYWESMRNNTVSSPLTDNAVGLSEEEKMQVGAQLGGVANAAVQGVVWNAIVLTGAALALYQSGLLS